ncbi:MAG: ROK family protein [Phycisphaerales bacterium]|nr:ROK family protein [Phycisphaerales bacterium]
MNAPGKAAALIGGIDIGGTKIGLSVGDAAGRVIASDRIEVDRELAPEAVLAECRERLGKLTAGRLAAVGCACPGPLDYAEGRFINPPNNPKWHGFGLRDWLKASFACPTAMMNDANAAALAEWKWGAARGTRTSVFLTMSTGMGAGLILDGRLYEGPNGLAGEIGRIRLRDTDDGPVGFGRRGSVEGYCSGPGMSQLALSEATACVHRNEMSMLVMIAGMGGEVPPELLCEAAMAGDAAARRVTDRVARELGRIMAIMTDILNPELFVLGTIGSAYPALFIPGAMSVVLEEAIPAAAERVSVKVSGLSDRGNQQALAVAARLLS